MNWARHATRYHREEGELFVGSADHAFARVCLACARLGLRPPEPDDPVVTGCRYGAFVSSIVRQLSATSGLNGNEINALIADALSHSVREIDRYRPKGA